jgi:tetraacyldisaccharide 4'-kinase
MLGLVAALRRFVYRVGLLRTRSLPVPVVVVGNLVVGGAGKTPTVLAVVDVLLAAGHRPGVVSRGHGRRGDAPLAVRPDTRVTAAGDEPLLLHLRSRVPVWVGRDRVAAARALLAAEPATTVLVSDDGLQHLALPRQVQLVVFDERGAGNGWLLPAGPLREPLPRGPLWPGTVPTRVLYNAPAATTALAGSVLPSRLPGAVDLVDWWAGEPAQPAALQALRGRRVLAAAGTARPQRFFAMLRAAGLDIAELPLPDHHPYATLPWPDATAEVVLTEKDAVKLSPGRLGPTRVWVVPLDLQLDADTARWLAEQLPAASASP